ncbi:unnamed protein product [Rotaria socialis]|uniref:Uncharacterized protein n=1 Tax=Rotaria socialis TaxID=392032 RepID=A0A820VDJ4_9BILA|nr:unnamed protein product [Rotaria socialis]CAF4499902.1 unnamed protein product [Rotaria socialis]
MAVQEEYRSIRIYTGHLSVVHPNSGMSPRLLRSKVRRDCQDIDERISHGTDPKRTSIDLYNNVKGSKEIRMELVAWVAVGVCKLEGSFARDWIVGNYTARPAIENPND